MAIDQIRVTGMAVVTDRGLVFGPIAGPLPALGAHDPLHRATGHIVALAAQPDPHLA
ncbi:hypothetical protein MALGJ_24460 [Mycolicibacter algericus]|uniref:Uncharacterized protein n=1 Tax=Mycolicibacter algericus TaxID=1288388 RepID=A0A7I9Y8V8_MYCAL|nr:hypothetical protein MALGJ_01360 [Mycolicibacter algericus]GFG84992.1 hypothetical protein MALGJ_16680 [Mycolicibacter algericus]GFG85566.1 hypothetical protein MALGJ_22420 [Mycolicibacter algericus]GFG85770.1 hypothetical protein MALGJ_24460 [Mycolicibacter algericus]